MTLPAWAASLVLVVSEYTQVHVPKGQCFNIIPRNPDPGEWGGMPLAFIQDDFTFFSKDLLRIDNSVAFAHFKKELGNNVHDMIVRTRF